MPEEVPDLYEVLGVERWADQSLIEEQYRRKHASFVQAGQPTEELESAYAVLSDAESRGEYDELLIEQDVSAFDAEQAEGDWEQGGGSGWSISKVISWGFSAFILLSILSGLCNNIREG